jgi:hypothetical protein
MDQGVNWYELQRAYICGEPVEETPFERRYPTLRELGAIHGIGHWKIGRRASRENWLGQRRKFQAMLRDEMCRREARFVASSLKPADE